MPKKQPSLGREPVQKVRNYEQSVKRTRLLCTKFHELIRLFHPGVSICSHILPIIPMLMLYSRELFEFASNSFPDVPQLLFQEVANAAFGVLNVHDGVSLCSKQISIVWASLVNTTILSPFSNRPTSSNSCIKLSKRGKVPRAQYVLKNYISSANGRSRSFGKSFCKSIPECACSTSSLHFRRAHSFFFSHPAP